MKTSKYEKSYSKLNTNEGMYEVYILAKTIDLTNVRCVKGKNQKVLINEEV